MLILPHPALPPQRVDTLDGLAAADPRTNGGHLLETLLVHETGELLESCSVATALVVRQELANLHKVQGHLLSARQVPRYVPMYLASVSTLPAPYLGLLCIRTAVYIPGALARFGTSVFYLLPPHIPLG